MKIHDNFTSKRISIVVRIAGGIGNQLFIYAMARRLSIVTNCDLVLDNISGFKNDFLYNRHYQLHHFNINCRMASFSERYEPFGHLRRKLHRVFNRFLPLSFKTFISEVKMDFDSSYKNYIPTKNIYLEGYWQCEDYFKDIETQIRQDLQIIPPKDSVNRACAESIQQHIAVAVHVRSFDELDGEESTNGNNASYDYYARAVRSMESQVSDAHYFLFSDRPEAARSRIPLPDDRITVVKHNLGDENAYADLWLMSHCQHFIIANSTFSWWGAWLSENGNKIVIAPGFEKRDGLCSWGFDGLLPKTWQKI